MSSVPGPGVEKKCATNNSGDIGPERTVPTVHDDDRGCNGTNTVINLVKRVKRTALGWVLRRRRAYDFVSERRNYQRTSTAEANGFGQAVGSVPMGYHCTDRF